MSEWFEGVLEIVFDWLCENWLTVVVAVCGILVTVITLFVLRRPLVAISIVVGISAVVALRWMIRQS